MNQLCVCRRRERDHVFRAPDVGPKGFLSSGVMAHIRRRMNHLLHTAVQALIRIRRQAQSILGKCLPRKPLPGLCSPQPSRLQNNRKEFPTGAPENRPAPGTTGCAPRRPGALLPDGLLKKPVAPVTKMLSFASGNRLSAVWFCTFKTFWRIESLPAVRRFKRRSFAR